MHIQVTPSSGGRVETYVLKSKYRCLNVRISQYLGDSGFFAKIEVIIPGWSNYLLVVFPVLDMGLHRFFFRRKSFTRPPPKENHAKKCSKNDPNEPGNIRSGCPAFFKQLDRQHFVCPPFL
jgi:hypothetical protein